MCQNNKQKKNAEKKKSCNTYSMNDSSEVYFIKIHFSFESKEGAVKR